MSALRWVLGALLFTALMLFALQNSDPVTLRFYHGWSWQAPLIFVLLLAFAAGAAAGLLAGAVRSARFKRQLARQRRGGPGEPVVPAPHGATPGMLPAASDVDRARSAHDAR